jgi:uncharacterized membrane protein YccC
MLTNWPAGTFAVFFAVLITSKNCTAPYLPAKALIPGAIVGILVGSVMYLGVMPALDGFWQLGLILFLFCTVGGYLMLSSNVKVAGVAGLTTIVAIKLINIQGHQTFSFSYIVDFSYGVLGGTFLAFIVFAVAWPIVPEKMFTGQVKAIVRSCREWLGAVSTDAVDHAASRSAFARTSARQLGLCLMWGKFLNYARLPTESRATVTRVIAALQSTLLHLMELDRMRRCGEPAPTSSALAQIVKRLDERLCNVLRTLEVSLEECRPVPQLPRSDRLLEELHAAFEELCGSEENESERRVAARRTLVMVGQYGALIKSLADLHAQLARLDWKSLNQSYF